MSGTTFPLAVLADFSRESYAKGRADGLQAARDAVDRMGRYGTDEMEPWDSAIGYALAAIDALRGDA